MTRYLAHLIARFSNWSVTGADRVLHDHVYAQRADWQRFLPLLILALGVGSVVSGVVFFFAYNWREIPDAYKLWMVQGLVVLVVLVACFAPLKQNTRNILLTGAAILVGVMFAVFGQVYQTGANAFDFFLGWTLFTVAWVVVSRFAPLWLLFVILVNTTVVTYAEQISDWQENRLTTVLILINMAFWIIGLLTNHFQPKHGFPKWYQQSIALFVGVVTTVGGMMDILDLSSQHSTFSNLLLGVPLLAFSAWYGMQTRTPFYIGLSAFVAIILVDALIVKIDLDLTTMFLVGVMTILGVTATIRLLVDLNKKWQHEQ